MYFGFVKKLNCHCRINSREFRVTVRGSLVYFRIYEGDDLLYNHSN